jgi:hypothetical protein
LTTQRFHTEAEIIRLGEGLIHKTLPKPEWTHAAHIAAAVYLVCRHPVGTPEREMPDLIRAYNRATGVENSDTGGYHETITQASLRAVRGVLATLPETTPQHTLANAVLDAGYADKAWLLRHWHQDTLFSVAARRGWVEPDKAPLP